MSNLERSIVTLIEPAIKVDKIMVEDSESKEAVDQKNPAAPSGDDKLKQSNRLGNTSPVIFINTTKYEEAEIDFFELDMYGPIPTINFSITDANRKMNISGPLDGDVISLYLRPPDEKNQRPIRIDFDITAMDPVGEGGFRFNGLMKIPGLYAETNKSFPKDSSFNHLQDVAEFLKIGFASNETTTEDKMVRLCPYINLNEFLDETVNSSYKDDDSFFCWFVDPYYYLNYVNVNKQFSLDDKTDPINITNGNLGLGWDQGDTEKSIKGSLVLTNKPDKAGTNVFIKNFSLENNAAAVSLSEGYKRYVQYYNVGDGKAKGEYVSNFVDPLTTKGAEDKLILAKGRRDEDRYKTQVKYKWLGKISGDVDGGNMHDNFIFSEVLNHQNKKEITKQSLKIEMEQMNFYIYKYMRIPVLIYQGSENNAAFNKSNQRDKDLGEDKPDVPPEGRNDAQGNTQTAPGGKVGDDQRDAIKNEFLTGYYVVSGIKYKWTSPGPISMEMTLLRREWPIPAKNKNY
jgi:hypothetical protein